MSESRAAENRNRGILTWFQNSKMLYWPWRILPWLTGLLVLNVTIRIVVNYGEYLPPNFQYEFLLGRESYFWGFYAWAFYLHIVTGPITLLLGLLLINKRFLVAFPKWHRFFGRTQVVTILFLMTPSGFWMAFYAASGPVASVGFACLALATGTCAALGWRCAVKRKFQLHQRWMWRCFLLLCSAVVLRLTAGFTIVIGAEREWVYPLSAWACWLVPLTLYELWEFAKGQRLIKNLIQGLR